MNKHKTNIVFIIFLLSCFSGFTRLFSQSIPDTTAKKDTLINLPAVPSASVVPSSTPASVPVPAPSSAIAKTEGAHNVISMEFIKEKVEHSPDSIFFNILKVSNNNAKPVQGVVRISVPVGWKVISDVETMVNITPGNTTLIPIRVSLARNAVGGVSYLVNATLYSNRTLFPDKNQSSVSKACYITIPKKVKWDIIPEYRLVYFDRYTQSAPFKLNLTNKGNGSQVVKLEFDIGSSLDFPGALGRKYFTTIELKPHSDTVMSFFVRYISPDESSLWNRDFNKLSIKVFAVSDSITKKTSVNFKYLESSFNNNLYDNQTPLTIELQLQNLLSDVSPRVLFGAWGFIWLKNNNTIDYNVRIPGISFSRNNNMKDFGAYTWQRSRIMVQYKADRWEVQAGDITGNGGIGLLTAFGRGVSGSYEINEKNKIGGAVAATLVNPIYSGNLHYQTTSLPRGIAMGTSLTYISDNYNKLNIFGADVNAFVPLFPGNSIYAILGVTQTQHNYNNQTFIDGAGNFITTVDPNTSFLGVGARVGYVLDRKKIKGTLTGSYSSPHFSQFFGSRLMLNGSTTYFINKKFYLIGNSNLTFQDPRVYNRGVLIPENTYLSGRHGIELADRVNSRLTLFAGPLLEHISVKQLKILPNGDSVFTRFKTISPKISLRVNYKTGVSGYVGPYALLGYTYIVDAQDSTIGIPAPTSKTVFYNAKFGLNVIQNNWGVNVFYYYGPHDLSTQGDYYYFGSYSKSIRIMPYFQKYYYNKLLLVSSYNSYYYEVHSNAERIALNARLHFNFKKGWSLFIDNNLYMYSKVGTEGNKIFSRAYYLSVGFRKSFDIPQPRVKYYDLKVVCFKDMNGNGKQDENEQGITDIIISIDRNAQTDSVTGKSVIYPGHFMPSEMITDNFGQVDYYHIPEGEFNVKIFPLMNLVDLYNINGQKQKVVVTRDTTFYVPFAQSYRVSGNIILNRDKFSSAGSVSTANIRITATDSLGNSFATLSTSDGSYTLYVPQAGNYKVTINNVFGDQFFLQESMYEVSFNGDKDFHVDFIFNEKKRQMNINGATGFLPEANDTIKTPQGSYLVIGNDTIKGITMVKDSTGPVVNDQGQPQKVTTYFIPAGPGISYKIQLTATSNRIPKSQYASRFKGVAVTEYAEDGKFKYTAGNLKTIDEAKDLKNILRTQGYKDAFLVPFYKGKRVRY